MQTDIATIDDIDALVALLGLLFEQEIEFNPNSELQRAGLRQILENPQSGQILGIRENEHIVGMVNLLYTVSTALGGKVALLEDMVIDPAQRGRGTGSRLLRYAREHARLSGCLRITLLTDDDNIDAQRFYLRQGFKPSAMKAFRLALTDPSDSA